MSSLTSQQSTPSIPFLKHQIEQLNYTLQIRQKKITYLQTQLKSIKAQYDRKISNLQIMYTQLKKKNTSFTQQMMQQKTYDHQHFQQQLKRIHQESNIKIMEKQKFYNQFVNQKEVRYQKTLRNMEIRYDNIISKIKEENKVLQHLLIIKQNNSSKERQIQEDIFTFNQEEFKYLSLDQYNNKNVVNKQARDSSDASHLIKQKTSMMEEIITYRKTQEKLKKELQTQRKLTLALQAEKKQLYAQFQEQKQLLQISIQNLNKKIANLNEQNENQKNAYISKIIQLQKKNQIYKRHLKQVDQNYVQALTNRSNSTRQIPVTSIKACNHQGLIYQLQKNLALKNEQIQQLQQRIKQWQKVLGFNKNVDKRLQQVGNISNRAQQVYKNQKSKIKKQVQRIKRN